MEGWEAFARGLAGKIVELYSVFRQEGEVAGPGVPGLHHRIVLTPEIERVNSGSGKMDYILDVSHYVEPEPVDLDEEFARLVDYERQREDLGRKMEGQLGGC